MSIITQAVAEASEIYTLGHVVRIVAAESASFSHTVQVLKKIMKEFPVATPDFVFGHVVEARFFKPEGLYKLGKAVGASASLLEEYKDA